MVIQKKILIVEDNQINRMMLRGILSTKYQVLEAENGLEAFSVLKEQKEEIALILLDIVMPVMDGYTFLSHLKANPIYVSIPVIVTTQKDGESDEVIALSYGATDFVTKPDKPQVILHRVAGIINLRETAAMINQVQYDRLTGLLNRRGVEYALESLQKEDMLVTFFLFDLDNLKQINDTYGHAEGDRFIKTFNSLLRSYTRATDFMSRYGGDEFAVVMKQMGTAHTACGKGEEICLAIRESCFAEKIPAAASAGIALWASKEPLGVVFERADAALYRAKAQNKGGCCLWEG